MNFTGIDSLYEASRDPEIRIDTTTTTPEHAADAIIEHLYETDILHLT